MVREINISVAGIDDLSCFWHLYKVSRETAEKSRDLYQNAIPFNIFRLAETKFSLTIGFLISKLSEWALIGFVFTWWKFRGEELLRRISPRAARPLFARFFQALPHSIHFLWFASSKRFEKKLTKPLNKKLYSSLIPCRERVGLYFSGWVVGVSSSVAL